MKKTLYFLPLFALLLVSCDKDSEKNMTKRLEETWRPQEVYSNGNRSTDPYWETYRLEMKDNKTYIQTDQNGAKTGSWDYNADRTKILFDGGNVTFDILELEKNRWKIKTQQFFGFVDIEAILIPA